MSDPTRKANAMQRTESERSETPMALIRVAVPILGTERRELEALICKRLGQSVDCEFVVDPEILGGVWVRVGDTVLDGSVRGRIEELRHHLRIQCRFMIANRFGTTQAPFPIEQPPAAVDAQENAER